KMLVLSRKVGEKLVIDGNITVEAVRIQGNRIALGLVAPSAVKILRGELQQKRAAVQVDVAQGDSNADQWLRQAC
ncbi:MAG: carbon storage regulator, partial [Aureliella sp.]